MEDHRIPYFKEKKIKDFFLRFWIHDKIRRIRKMNEKKQTFKTVITIDDKSMKMEI